MNELSTHTSGALAAPSANPFAAYAEAAAGNAIVGDLLKFAKGDWLFGRNGDEMARGTRLVANIIDLKVGWVCWKDGKPTETLMGRVADAFRPALRSALGDTDESEWELDNEGRPRDPWQLTNTLILKAEDGEALYTFSTSSRGGISALGKLSGEYGKRCAMKPNEIPVIALEVDSYNHSDKTRGKIKVPVFKVVGWTDKSAFDDALAAEQAAQAEGGEDGLGDDLPFDEPAPAPKGKGKAKAAANTQF